MESNRFDGSPSNSFLTLLICLQCSDHDLGGGIVTRDVLYEPKKQARVLLFFLEFFQAYQAQ